MEAPVVEVVGDSEEDDAPVEEGGVEVEDEGVGFGHGRD